MFIVLGPAACTSSDGPAAPVPDPASAAASSDVASRAWKVWAVRNLPTWRKLRDTMEEVNGQGIDMDAVREVERLAGHLDPMPEREQRHLDAFRTASHS